MAPKIEYRNFRSVQARSQADRELQGVVVRLPVPKSADRHFAYDLRRGRRRVYGSLLRFIDLAAAAGVSKDVVKLIPGILDSYIDDVFTDSPRAA